MKDVRLSTALLLGLMMAMLVVTLVSCAQSFRAQMQVIAVKAQLEAQAKVSAAHVAELKAMPSKEVVIELGPKGYISYFWGMSGLSTKYTLDEYLAAVSAPKGADVYTPVEGDHFIVPWPSK